MSVPFFKQVNSHSDSTSVRPQFSGFASGGWLVSWSGSYTDDPLGIEDPTFETYFRIFNKSGESQREFIVDRDFTDEAQVLLDVTVLSSGGFFVTFRTEDTQRYLQQHYASNGSAIGDPVQIAQDTDDAGYQYIGSAALQDGGWVTVSEQYGNSDNLVQTVYNSAGSVLSSSVLATVGDNEVLEPGFSRIVSLADNGWLVYGNIQSRSFGDGNSKLFRYDANHDLVATYDVDDGYEFMAPTADGGWILTGVTDTDRIYVERYDDEGNFVVKKNVTPVTGYAEGQNYGFAAIADGGFVVAWTDSSASSSLYLARYGADNKLVGLIVDLADRRGWSGGFTHVDIEATEDGGWIIVLDASSGDGAVFQQRFDKNGNEVYYYNTAPQGDDISITALEDRPFRFHAADFDFNDSDNGDTADGFLGILITSLPGEGKLRLDGKAVKAGQTILASDIDDLTFQGEKDAFGKNYAHFGYRLLDDGTNNAGGTNMSAKITAHIAINDVVDVFKGTARGEKLAGTAGSDRLDGLAGNDRLVGGAGPNTFVFGKRYDKDVITDFSTSGKGHDVIDLGKLSSITDFKDLKLHHLEDHGGDTWIVGGRADTLVLKGIEIDELKSSDFLF